MPVFDVPQPQPEPKNPPVSSTPKPFKHSVVDSVDTPIETLVTYIGGSNWVVDYYSQIVGEDEALKAFDPQQHIAYQAYHKIDKFILKLQGALTPSDENETGRMEYTGMARIPPNPGLIPNQYDAFIADIGEGSAGLFTVTSVRKLTLNLATVYEIEFSLARLADRDITAKIDAKSSKRSYYNRDLLVLGQNPILQEEDFNALGKLEHYLEDITANWLATNFSHDNATLILPNQDSAIYDQYVVRAAMRVMDIKNHPLLATMKVFNVDDHRFPKHADIYQAIIERNKSILYRCFRKYMVFDVTSLTPSYYQNSIRYSNVDYTVVPSTANLDSDNYQVNVGTYDTGNLNYTGNSPASTAPVSCPADPSIPCDVTDGTIPGDVDSVVYNNTDSGMSIPYIGPDSYVLPERFYNWDFSNTTKFELMVRDILDKKVINYGDVYPFAESFTKWGRLEQFYYGPILICMIKAAMRSL